jgi:hypothetical protein
MATPSPSSFPPGSLIAKVAALAAGGQQGLANYLNSIRFVPAPPAPASTPTPAPAPVAAAPLTPVTPATGTTPAAGTTPARTGTTPTATGTATISPTGSTTPARGTTIPASTTPAATGSTGTSSGRPMVGGVITPGATSTVPAGSTTPAAGTGTTIPLSGTTPSGTNLATGTSSSGTGTGTGTSIGTTSVGGTTTLNGILANGGGVGGLALNTSTGTGTSSTGSASAPTITQPMDNGTSATPLTDAQTTLVNNLTSSNASTGPFLGSMETSNVLGFNVGTDLRLEARALAAGQDTTAFVNQVVTDAMQYLASPAGTASMLSTLVPRNSPTALFNTIKGLSSTQAEVVGSQIQQFFAGQERLLLTGGTTPTSSTSTSGVSTMIPMTTG